MIKQNNSTISESVAEEPKRISSLGYSLAVEEFFDKSGLNEILRKSFSVDDVVRIRYIVGLYHLYGPAILDCEGIVWEYYPRGFLPIMRRMDTADLCERIADASDAFYQKWAEYLSPEHTQAIPVGMKLDIINSGQLGYEYRWNAFFDHDGTVWYKKYLMLRDSNKELPVCLIPMDDREEYRTHKLMLDTLKKKKDTDSSLLIKEKDIRDQKALLNIAKKRNLTIWLDFDPDLRKIKRLLEDPKTASLEVGLPGNIAAVTENYEWKGLSGRLLIGLSDENRKIILNNFADELKSIRRQLSAGMDPLYIDGSKYFDIKEDEATGRITSIVQNKRAVKEHREDAGYFLIFTTDTARTPDQLVRDYYELLYISDYYGDIRSRAWEWIGFDEYPHRVMEGMTLLFMLEEMLDTYWLKRINGIKKLRKKHERDIMREIRCLQGNYDADGRVSISGENEENIRLLKALGYDMHDLEDYVTELCTTDGYFDEYDEWINEDS